MAGKRGGLHSYTVQETQNATMGQAGSILVSGTSAVTCLNGVFVAITFLEDTIFNSTDGLVAETTQTYLDDAGTSTNISTSNGAAIDGETFPAGVTIYGRWTSILLDSGKVIAYVGE